MIKHFTQTIEPVNRDLARQLGIKKIDIKCEPSEHPALYRWATFGINGISHGVQFGLRESDDNEYNGGDDEHRTNWEGR